MGATYSVNRLVPGDADLDSDVLAGRAPSE